MNIAEKIDLLFKTITNPDGTEYSYREIEDLSKGAISSTAVWKLRMGKTQKPREKTLQALSEAFRVSVTYFHDDSPSLEDIREYREQYRSDKLAEQIALRAYDLDEDVKRTILDMINHVRRTRDTETQRKGRGGRGRGQRQNKDASLTG